MLASSGTGLGVGLGWGADTSCTSGGRGWLTGTGASELQAQRLLLPEGVYSGKWEM